MSHDGLRKQLTFRGAATSFPTKRRRRNQCRNSILMRCHYPPRQSFSLAEANLKCGMTNQEYYPDLGNDRHQYGISDVISRGNQWCRRKMSTLYAGVRHEDLWFLPGKAKIQSSLATSVFLFHFFLKPKTSWLNIGLQLLCHCQKNGYPLTISQIPGSQFCSECLFTNVVFYKHPVEIEYCLKNNTIELLLILKTPKCLESKHNFPCSFLQASINPFQVYLF